MRKRSLAQSAHTRTLLTRKRQKLADPTASSRSVDLERTDDTDSELDAPYDDDSTTADEPDVHFSHDDSSDESVRTDGRPVLSV